jgi:hypothetical protein
MTRSGHIENIETTGKIIGIVTAVAGFVAAVLKIITYSMEIHSSRNIDHHDDGQTPLAGAEEESIDS